MLLQEKRRYVNFLCFCQTPNSMCPVALHKLFWVHHVFCPTYGSCVCGGFLQHGKTLRVPQDICYILHVNNCGNCRLITYLGRLEYCKILSKYEECLLVFTHLLILHLWTLLCYITNNLLIYAGHYFLLFFVLLLSLSLPLSW